MKYIHTRIHTRVHTHNTSKHTPKHHWIRREVLEYVCNTALLYVFHTICTASPFGVDTRERARELLDMLSMTNTGSNSLLSMLEHEMTSVMLAEVYVRVCVHVYVCVCIFMCVYVRLRVYVSKCVYLSVCNQPITQTHTHIEILARTQTSRLNVHSPSIYTCIHVHIHTPKGELAKNIVRFHLHYVSY